jgi:DNA-binding CsgD family transcriptional regulator
MDGYDLLTAAAETLADAEPETATALLAEATLAAFHAGDTAAMSAAAARAAQLSEAAGTSSAEIAGSVAQSLALVISGDGSQGAAYARRAIEVVEAGPELPDDPQALVWAALARLIVREADVGRDLVARVDRTARERAEIGLLPYLLTLVGRDQATTDQWAAAHASYDEAVRLARETGARAELGTLLAGWAWLAGRQGREDLCRSRAAEGAAICADVGSGLYQLWCIQALGYLELGLGQLPAAVREFEKQRTVMSERGITDVDLSPVPELVELYLRMERRSEAEALAEPYLAAAAAKAQPWSQARAHRCAGLLAGDDEADESFERALEFHASTPDVFETARTELAYGARLRRARRRVDARAHLHTALAAFERLSAEPWVEQTSAELAATGETARVRDVTTLVQLTPQEFQIARLLADGATTRQAAAATFLSPKTIEYHLRSVYRKLGLHSRQELAEVMRSGR